MKRSTDISARELRRILLLSSIGTLLLTLLLVLAVTYLPLHNLVQEMRTRTLRHETTLLAQVIDETLKRASDLGWQVSSRTAARRLMSDYHSGRMERAEAVSQLRPIIRDAVAYTDDIHGLLRMDAKGSILVRSGPSALDTMLNRASIYRALHSPPLRFVDQGSQRFSSVFRLGRQVYFIVETPIFSPNQEEIGKDLLLFSLESMEQILGQAQQEGYAGLVLAGGPGGPEHIVYGTQRAQPPSSEQWTLLRNARGVDPLDLGASGMMCIREIRGSHWWLALQIGPPGILPLAGSILKNMVLSILLIGLLSFLGSFILLKPLRHKLLVAQQDSHRRIEDLDGIRAKLEEQGKRLAERNENLLHFARASAHDLKSPLVSIGGHARILLEKLGPELPENRRRSLEFILESAKRMHHHVADMLEYSHAAEAEPVFGKVQLDLVLEEVLHGMESLVMDSAAQIEVSGLCEVNGDRRFFQMILHNLIENALCYHQPDAAPHIMVRARIQQDILFLSVEDHGLGIAPELVPRIFESYFRIHENGKQSGSGLGLAIVERAVHRMGGTISLESELGKGSCFTVVIPGQQHGDDTTSERANDDPAS